MELKFLTMKNLMLTTDKFTDMGPLTKVAINNGYWFLYKIDIRKTPYMLIANKDIILFSKKGKMIPVEKERPKDIKYLASVYFEDLPFPPSLTNLFYEEDTTSVPYTITGNGVGRKKASDIIKSFKIKKQIDSIKLAKQRDKKI